MSDEPDVDESEQLEDEEPEEDENGDIIEDE